VARVGAERSSPEFCLSPAEHTLCDVDSTPPDADDRYEATLRRFRRTLAPDRGAPADRPDRDLGAMSVLAVAAMFRFDDAHLFAIAVVAAVVAITVSAIRRPPRRCTRCREINREQAIYCAQCGTKLPE